MKIEDRLSDTILQLEEALEKAEELLKAVQCKDNDRQSLSAWVDNYFKGGK